MSLVNITSYINVTLLCEVLLFAISESVDFYVHLFPM